MDIRKLLVVAILAVALVPAAAGAQQAQNTQAKPTLDQLKHDTPQDAIIPFIGTNTGGGLFGSENVTEGLSTRPMTYGASILFWGPGVLAGEFDFGYSPKFYDGLDVVASDASTDNVTMTLNFFLGPTFYIGENQRIRPYGLIGGGLMRSSISEFTQHLSFSDKQNLGVWDIGGGVYYYPTRHIGVRGDLRMFRAVGADSSENGWGDISGWNWFRLTVGVAIGF
jgi:hypothetical protein